MEIFNAIYKNLALMYVDTLDAEVVVGNGINAMLRRLAPSPTYYPEQKMKEVSEQDLIGARKVAAESIKPMCELQYELAKEKGCLLYTSRCV